MHYYLVDNKIVKVEEPFDSNLYSYQKLTNEQVEFLEQHPTASVDNILAMNIPTPPEISLEDYKANKKDYYSKLSFSKREQILPEYKIENAALGIYDTTTTSAIINCVTAFRTEYYRLADLIDACTTKEEVDNIEDNFDSITLQL